MKSLKTFLAVVIVSAFAAPTFTTKAVAGPCEHSYDRDSAGNSCGGRAADQRKGGR
jgi:hypothetical protein